MLIGAVFALIVGTALIGMAAKKTVRAQGWGKERWEPTAIRWFVAGLVIAAISFALFAIYFTAR
ncbi:hypothetical protein [Curtobacterium sp. PsM8]|uniref:hypothetical protein n=1 Tax=Curtobacterium sp. PsM8 TaxID=3030532 RepID=UPI00263BCB4A|nr:hypothetical protein [Curtobacterium sp. PsM8]MDN4648146.1 hypothetical protein [Curtobacterium sp. PsM8]